jgi:hypothetical protein
MVAAGAIVAKTLRPLTIQPSAARVAVVDGRVRSCGAGSLAAAANTTSAMTTARKPSAMAAALRSLPRAEATCHERTTLRRTAKCMFTPIAVAGSPRASRDDATRTSWIDVTPPPPSSAGTGATRNRSARSFSRCSTANVPSRSWALAPAAKSSTKEFAAATISAPASVAAPSSKPKGSTLLTTAAARR